MYFKLFRKKRRLELPGKSDIDVPPAPLLMQEGDIELPTFPTIEEAAEEPKLKESAVPSDVEEMEMEAIRGVEGELEERGNLQLKKPIFIEAKLYKAVMDDVTVLKNALKDSTDTLQTMSDLKDDREKSYGLWHKQIEDIERKLIYVDNSLFGKKSGP